MIKKILISVYLCANLIVLTACTNGLGSAFGDPVPDDSTSLDALIVSNGTLSPAFDATVTSYSVRLGEVSSVYVVPMTLNVDAKVSVNGVAQSAIGESFNIDIVSGAAVASIEVAAPGAAAKTYTVSFYVDDFVVQDAYLKSDEPSTNADFGHSVAVSGSVVVVGESNENKAYVFEKKSDGNWFEKAILSGSNTESYDLFGGAVAVSDTIIVVGAFREDSSQLGITNIDGIASSDNSSIDSGAVYVFKKDSSGNWIQDAYLKASNAGSDDSFGLSVAVSGDRIVVGSCNEDSNQTVITNTNGVASSDNSKTGSGAVYVFGKNSAGNWVQDAYLKASNADEFDSFGCSVAVDGDTVAIGALGEQGSLSDQTNTDGEASSVNNGYRTGAVYLFKKDSVGDWYQDAFLKPGGVASAAESNFGRAVSLSGSTLVVGTRAGIANVFTSDDSNNWNLEAVLKPSSYDQGDWFGEVVCTSGDIIVVGATYESSAQSVITNIDGVASSDNSLGSSGAAYLFKKNADSTWVQDAYLKASNPRLADFFGASVAIDQNVIVVGAIREDSAQSGVINEDGEASSDNSWHHSGAAYIFKIEQ